MKPNSPPGGRQRVNSVRAIATGLLVVAFCIYLTVRVFEKNYPWLGFVGAFAEASVVGGLADWFAVVALFRHPLGIKFKHTAILPNSKDKIADGLADFVKKEFLTPKAIEEKLCSLHIADKASDWLNKQQNITKCVAVLSAILPKLLATANDEELRHFVRENILKHLKQIHFAPHLGGMLRAFMNAGRHHDVIAEILRSVSSAIKPNRTLIWNKVRSKIRIPNILWAADKMADAVTDGLVNGTIEELEEAARNLNHPLRHQFTLKVDVLILELETSDKYTRVLNDMKAKFLTGTGVSEFVNSAWQTFKTRMLAELSDPSSELCCRLGSAISAFGTALQKDDAFRQKLDQYILSSASYVADSCGKTVADMIRTQFAKWDGTETAKKLEEKVGEDLQYIRINGALVGGIVGVLLYLINKVTFAL